MKGRKSKEKESVILREKDVSEIKGKPDCRDGEVEAIGNHLPLLLARPGSITAISALGNAPGTLVQGTEQFFHPTHSLNEKKSKVQKQYKFLTFPPPNKQGNPQDSRVWKRSGTP